MKKLLLPLLLTLLLNFGVGALAHEQPVSAGASDIGETVVAVEPSDESRTIRTTDDPGIDQMTDPANNDSSNEYGYTTRFERTITKDVDVTYNIDVNITININRTPGTDTNDTQNNNDVTPQPIVMPDTTPIKRNTDDLIRNNDTNTTNRRDRRDRRNRNAGRRVRETDNTENNTENNEEENRNYSITEGDNTGRVRLDPDGNNPRPQPKCPCCA